MVRFLGIFYGQDKIGSVAQTLLLEPLFCFFNRIFFGTGVPQSTLRNVGLRLSGNQTTMSGGLGEKGQAGFLMLLSQQCSSLECTSSC